MSTDKTISLNFRVETKTEHLSGFEVRLNAASDKNPDFYCTPFGELRIGLIEKGEASFFQVGKTYNVSVKRVFEPEVTYGGKYLGTY